MSFLKYTCLISAFILLLAGILMFQFGGGLLGIIMTPVSIASKVIGQDSIKETDGRTNILLLGSDKRTTNSSDFRSSTLTDTIIVISIGKAGDSTSIISIPRDLWVSEISEKINALYAFKGIDQVKIKIEEVLGMPIHYYGIVDFDAFKESVDAVGGITIQVDESFSDDLYPIEGKEDALPESARYMTVRFNKGEYVFDGEKALQFARSRHSSNPREAGDFARARRQQKVIVALKDKVLSSSTLLNPTKIQELYQVFQDNVETDVSLKDTLMFYSILENVEFNNIQKIVLSDEPFAENKFGSGLLISPTQEERDLKFNGKYVLTTISGNFDEIKTTIRQILFCEKSQEGCQK